MNTPAAAPAQLLLPYAEREWIDVARARRILGVGGNDTIYLLRRPCLGRPYIEGIDFGKNKRQRILYASVVRYCDWLREHYALPDRRPALPNSIFRHRDEDLLPFPLAETIGVPEAQTFLPYDSTAFVFKRLEEGAFHAYKLMPGSPTSPWRICRPDFARWLQRAHDFRR